MSKVLLWLAFIFILISLVNADNPFVVTPDLAPTYCQGFVPPGPTTPGTTYTTGTSGGSSLVPGAKSTIPIISYMTTPTGSTQPFYIVAIADAAIALTLSFSTIALAFILSRLVPTLGIRNWLQAEYWEVTKSAILIAVIFAIITIIADISYAFLSSPVSPNPGDITPVVVGAESYLCTVNYQLMDIWSWMGILGGGTGFWSNLKLGLYDPFPTLSFYYALLSGSTFIPFNNWMLQTGNPMISFYGSIIGDTINLLLFPFSVITISLIDVLPSMVQIGLGFFVPLGILFRAFPFIRGIGGTIVAIGLGMAVIFPAILIIFNGVFMNYIQQATAITPPPPPDPSSFSDFRSICPFAHTGLPKGVFGLVGQITCTTIPDSLGFINVLCLFQCSTTVLQYEISYTVHNERPGYLDGANLFANNAVYQYMDVIMSLGLYVILQLVVVTIDLVLLYSITDSIAKALGGTIRFQLGGKLRIAS